MLDLFYAIPAALLLTAALAVTVVFAGIGQNYVHRRFSNQDFVAHNEVGGVIIAVAGTLYAVTLGFLTVVTWQHFAEARQLVVLESDADIDAWHMAVGLPADVRTQIRRDMLTYANLMIDREWPAMRHGGFDRDAAEVQMDAMNAAGSYVPTNMGESNAQAATLERLDAMHDARQQRIEINNRGVSWFEWLVLLIGALCVICFCWLFGLKNPRTQLLMTSAVATIVVSTLILLFELQFPFRSNVGIGPVIWQAALAHLHQMEAGNQMNMRM